MIAFWQPIAGSVWHFDSTAVEAIGYGQRYEEYQAETPMLIPGGRKSETGTAVGSAA